MDFAIQICNLAQQMEAILLEQLVRELKEELDEAPSREEAASRTRGFMLEDIMEAQEEEERSPRNG